MVFLFIFYQKNLTASPPYQILLQELGIPFLCKHLALDFLLAAQIYILYIKTIRHHPISRLGTTSFSSPKLLNRYGRIVVLIFQGQLIRWSNGYNMQPIRQTPLHAVSSSGLDIYGIFLSFFWYRSWKKKKEKEKKKKSRERKRRGSRLQAVFVQVCYLISVTTVI